MKNEGKIENKLISIKISSDIYNKLEEIKEKNKLETFSDAIRSLIEKREHEEIVSFPNTINDLIIETIEEVKPPSKWRDLMIYLAVGILGGIGLGIVLPI